MALFNCQECGHSISTSAKACPSCGAKPRVPVTKSTFGVGKLVAVAVVGWIAFQLAGGGEHPAPPEPDVKCFEQSCRSIDSLSLISRSKDALRTMLKDPDSARFANLKYVPKPAGKLSAVCGTYNARNGFGGYGNPEQFISLGTPGLTYTESNSTEFSVRWKEHCEG